MILCNIYIYPTQKSHTSPINSQRSLVNCFDHRVDRIRQVDLSQAMQNRPACKTAVEESIRTTGTQWDHFPSKVAMGFLAYQRSLVGGDWNHGILWLSIDWEFHPNWRTHIFQRGWNHQPDHVYIWFNGKINEHHLKNSGFSIAVFDCEGILQKMKANLGIWNHERQGFITWGDNWYMMICHLGWSCFLDGNPIIPRHQKLWKSQQCQGRRRRCKWYKGSFPKWYHLRKVRERLAKGESARIPPWPKMV